MAFGGRLQQKMSEETFDFVCTSCAEDNKTVEAVKFCVECSGYCCQNCTEAHKFPALRSHNLLDVNQGKQASGQPSSLPEFPTERCSIHKGKVVDMYCEGHDAVGCYVCISKDHKSCEDSQIHSIPDMIDTIFNLSDYKQTHSLLRDIMVSMETVSKDKDTKLQSLNKAKKEVMGKVNVFQKALEAILSKIAESSRKEIEAVYKQLETDFLNEQRTVESICEALKMADDKLIKSEGNRAQRFVCTKIAKGKIMQAGDGKAKYDLQHDLDMQISFIPNESLMEYIQALQGIGQVQKHDPYNIQALQGFGQVQKHKKQKNDLYKIIRRSDITMTLPGDSNVCFSAGCCLTHDNQLFVTDFQNKKVKRIDIQKMLVVEYCTLDAQPYGVCCISKHEVAVACQNYNKIQFVSIHNKMTPTKQIKMSHPCYGIAFNDGKLHVTDYRASVYVYDMTGCLLMMISQDYAGNKLFNYSQHISFNESGDRMFVGGANKGLLCFDGLGNYLSTINDTDIKDADGVCVDGRGNMFVVGYISTNVVQVSEDGKKLGVVVDGLHGPRSVCFHPELNRMFVTMNNSDVLKMYELE